MRTIKFHTTVIGKEEKKKFKPNDTIEVSNERAKDFVPKYADDITPEEEEKPKKKSKKKK